jgi:hypothetical protein
MSMEGQCLCGAVRVVVESHDPALSACHCELCRRWSGGPQFGLNVPADAVRIEGPVGRYASSSFAERTWCETCGTHLWFRDTDDAAAAYEFVPGIFGYRDDLVLDRENYADRAGPMALAGRHRRLSAADYEMSNRVVAEGDER